MFLCKGTPARGCVWWESRHTHRQANIWKLEGLIIAERRFHLDSTFSPPSLLCVPLVLHRPASAREAGRMQRNRTYRAVFNSKCPQRADATGRPAGLAGPSPDIGPGAYDPRPGYGQPFWKPWLNDPMKMNSTFASKTQKSPLPRPLTADINLSTGAEFLPRTNSAAPGSQASKWPQNPRKPPHFHPPFRAYPMDTGAPKGREKGLDEYYELDVVSASPTALHGTLAINMKRTNRLYASSFKSKAPQRFKHNTNMGAGALGPGSYPVDRTFLKASDRPSTAFIPYSGGMWKGVGGSYEDWLKGGAGDDDDDH